MTKVFIPYSHQHREQTLQQGLAAALVIRDESRRARALVAFAPYLQGEMLQEGLTAVLALRDESRRTWALAAFAPYLPEESREQALRQGLTLALAIKDGYKRAKAVAAFTPYLQGEMLQEGLTAVLALRDESRRAWALAAFAPHLQGEMLQQGLTAMLGIRDEFWRARVLAAFAPHLQGEMLQQGLLTIEDESRRAWVLATFAPHLQGKMLQQGLATLEIEDKNIPSKAAAVLVTNLQENLPQQRLIDSFIRPSEETIQKLIQTQRFYAAWVAGAFLALFIVLLLSTKLLSPLLGSGYLLVPVSLLLSVGAYFGVMALYQHQYNRQFQQAMDEEFKRNPEFYSNLEHEIDLSLHN